VNDREIDLFITIVSFATAIIYTETDSTFNFMEMETVVKSQKNVKVNFTSLNTFEASLDK